MRCLLQTMACLPTTLLIRVLGIAVQWVSTGSILAHGGGFLEAWTYCVGRKEKWF